MHQFPMRASLRPQTDTQTFVMTPIGLDPPHDTPSRPESAAGLTPDEIRQIVLDILG